jgi:SAM-dependent methyltransferase
VEARNRVKPNVSETWENLVRDISLNDILRQYETPSEFQKGLGHIIEDSCSEIQEPSSIEVGAFWGVTSALLPRKFEKTLLDNSAKILEKAGIFYRAIGQNVTLLRMDVLDLDKIESRYDVVFSSGLLEHFDFPLRKRICSKMHHITRNGGYLIIAIPNQNSLPYRLGYLFRMAMGQWPYPAEFKIKNLDGETKSLVGIKMVAELDIDKDGIYGFLPKTLKRLMRILNKWVKYEGYLKVFVFKK